MKKIILLLILGVGALFAGDKNILINASFEVGLYGWQTKFREINGYKNAPFIDFLDPQPIIDTAVYYDGKKSLRVDVPQNGQVRVMSLYHRITPNRDYTFSVWVKSETEKRRVVLSFISGKFPNATSISDVRTIGKEWERISITKQFPSIQDSLSLVEIQTLYPGKLWIDGAQWEEGALSDFQTRQEVELSVTSSNGELLFTPKSNVSFILQLYNSSNERVTKKIICDAVDPNGTLSFHKIVDVKCLPGKSFKKSFSFQPELQGLYHIILRKDEKGPPESEMLVGIIPKPEQNVTGGESPFGSHFRVSPRNLVVSKKLGIRWVRLHLSLLTKWEITEPDSGKYQWFDAYIDSLKKEHFEILGSLGSIPHWASTAPPQTTSRDFESYLPKDISLWEHYVANIVSRYKDKIQYWEVLNEPDLNRIPEDPVQRAKNYVTYLTSAYASAKKANPQCTIVGGVGEMIPQELWVERIFKEGAAKYLDVLSFHYYLNGKTSPDENKPPLNESVKKIRDLMKQYNISIPIWNTEGGVNQTKSEYDNIVIPVSQNEVDGKETAENLVRSYVSNLAAGVDKYFYFTSISSDDMARNELTGLFEFDRSPKTGAIAFAVMASMIENTKFQKEENQDSVHIFQFKGKGKNLGVLWSMNNETQSLTVKNLNFPTSPSFYDLNGNKIKQVAGEIKIGRAPIYAIY